MGSLACVAELERKEGDRSHTGKTSRTADGFPCLCSGDKGGEI